MKKNGHFLIKFFIGILFLCGIPFADSALWQMPSFFIPGESNALIMSLQASDDGHVMLVRRDDNEDLSAFYYTNGQWLFSDLLLASPSSFDNFDVAMSPSGTALTLFNDNNTNSIRSKYFNGTVWITPFPNPLDTLTGGPNSFAVGVAMNGAGQGVGVWNDGVNMKAAFFNGAAWTISQNIGAGYVSEVTVAFAYGLNGPAVALWEDTGLNMIVINNFNGITWQPAPQVLLPTNTFGGVGISANGIAYTIWEDGNNINVTPFNAVTSTVLPFQTISTGLGNFGSSIAVAPAGTAVATWVDSLGGGQSSIFNGTTWSAPIPFTTGLVDDPVVSVDNNGNALVVWHSVDTGEIMAARLPFGAGVWSAPELVSEPIFLGLDSLQSALSTNGIGFAAWNFSFGEVSLGFANASLLAPPPPLPTPPLAIFGRHCDNRFVTQTECVNIITFTPSTDPTVVAYYLYRNGILIAVIPASGPFIYEDHNTGNVTDVYSLTAVDAQGIQSPPVFVVLGH